MSDRHLTDHQRVLADLAAHEPRSRAETSVVVHPGGTAAAWAVKITSHVARNVYAVCVVALNETGVPPTALQEQTEAINLGESFLAEGTLAAGTYAVMFRLGDNNVFSVRP